MGRCWTGGPPAQQDRPSPQRTRDLPAGAACAAAGTAQPRADASPSRAIAAAPWLTPPTGRSAPPTAWRLLGRGRLAIDECRRESTDKDDCTRGAIVRQDSCSTFSLQERWRVDHPRHTKQTLVTSHTARSTGRIAPIRRGDCRLALTACSTPPDCTRRCSAPGRRGVLGVTSNPGHCCPVQLNDAYP